MRGVKISLWEIPEWREAASLFERGLFQATSSELSRVEDILRQFQSHDALQRVHHLRQYVQRRLGQCSEMIPTEELSPQWIRYFGHLCDHGGLDRTLRRLYGAAADASGSFPIPSSSIHDTTLAMVATGRSDAVRALSATPEGREGWIGAVALSYGTEDKAGDIYERAIAEHDPEGPHARRRYDALRTNHAHYRFARGEWNASEKILEGVLGEQSSGPEGGTALGMSRGLLLLSRVHLAMDKAMFAEAALNKVRYILEEHHIRGRLSPAEVGLYELAVSDHVALCERLGRTSDAPSVHRFHRVPNPSLVDLPFDPVDMADVAGTPPASPP